MAKIVLTGGGTAGHIIPNIALISELNKYFDSIHYIGSQGMEKSIVPKYKIPFHSTQSVKFDRNNLLINAKIPFVLHKSINEAKSILELISPDVVFSKGGYVSLPTCYAAKSLKIPVVTHESDYSLGLANKLIASFATKVLTSFSDTEGIYVGSPVREEIFKGDKKKLIKEYNLQENRKTILIMGGSLGSEAINGVVKLALPELKTKYNILHIAGINGEDITEKNYVQRKFVDNINDYYACCDCAVSRGGANSLAELTSLNIPSLIIPLPKGTSRGDQIQNSYYYQREGKVTVLEQGDLYVESLIFNINNLLKKPKKAHIFHNPNKAIVKEILSIIK